MPPLTEQQINDRRKWIGSSDIAALFDRDPFRTKTEVWLEKTNRLESDKTTAAQKRGHYMEHACITFAEDELNTKIDRDVFVSGAGGLLAANLDGAIRPNGSIQAVVEAKSYVPGSPDHGAWGEDPYTDLVPERVILQTHVQMYCADASLAWVPGAEPAYRRFAFKMYKVERHEGIVDAILEVADDFWCNYVQKDIEPEKFDVPLNVLKRIRREPQSIIEVPDSVVNEWRTARDARLAAERVEKGKLEVLLLAMRDHEAAQCTTGLFRYPEELHHRAKNCPHCGEEA